MGSPSVVLREQVHAAYRHQLTAFKAAAALDFSRAAFAFAVRLAVSERTLADDLRMVRTGGCVLGVSPSGRFVRLDDQDAGIRAGGH